MHFLHTRCQSLLIWDLLLVRSEIRYILSIHCEIHRKKDEVSTTRKSLQKRYQWEVMSEMFLARSSQLHIDKTSGTKVREDLSPESRDNAAERSEVL